MTPTGLKVPDRGLQRALDRRGSKPGKSPRVASVGTYSEGAACAGCGAVYSRKTWRRAAERKTAPNRPAGPRCLCPACIQTREVRGYGRVSIRGPWLKENEDEVRRRIRNVEARARHTQPERRVVRVGRVDGGIEVMSTSQKLAHRLVREFEKAFGGRSTYKWSDRDGSLFATWTHD